MNPYLKHSIYWFTASILIVWLSGCTMLVPDVAYRKSCWESALGACAGARYALGLDKRHIRFGVDDSAVLAGRVVGHAWCEIYYKGKWRRISDKGAWYTESTWQDMWIPDRYYLFDAAFDRAKRFRPRTHTP